jgi:hypothetical protein
LGANFPHFILLTTPEAISQNLQFGILYKTGISNVILQWVGIVKEEEIGWWTESKRIGKLVSNRDMLFHLEGTKVRRCSYI